MSSISLAIALLCFNTSMIRAEQLQCQKLLSHCYLSNLNADGDPDVKLMKCVVAMEKK